MQIEETNNSITKKLAEIIREYCIRFDSQTNGLVHLAQESGISKRNIYRILSEETKRPQPATAIALLKVIKSKAKNESELLIEVAKDDLELAKYLQSGIENAQLFDNNIISSEIDHFIDTNAVYREIYTLISTGPTSKEDVQKRFGTYGTEMLELMAEQGLAQQNEISGMYGLGLVHPFLNASTSHLLAKDFLTKNFSPEKLQQKGENAYSMFFCPLEVDEYNEVLQANVDYTKRLRDIIKKSKKTGPVRAWMIAYTDTLNDEWIHKGELEQ